MTCLELTRDQERNLVMPFSLRGDKFLSSTLEPEVEQWCEDNLISIPTVSINFIGNERVKIITLIDFSSENDALLFKMRWL